VMWLLAPTTAAAASIGSFAWIIFSGPNVTHRAGPGSAGRQRPPSRRPKRGHKFGMSAEYGLDRRRSPRDGMN
jgi:hypothetical protein